MALQSAERKVLKFTDALMSDGRQAKDRLGLDTRWREYRRVYDGPGQWLGTRAPSIFVNFIKNYTMRAIAGITQSKPEMLVVSKRADYGGSAKILTDTTKAFWNHYSIQDKITRAALTCAITGAVGFGLEWNQELDGERGDVDFKIYPPECLFLDPAVSAADEIQQGSYCFVKQLVPIADLVDAYPGRGQLVEPMKSRGDRSTVPVQTSGRRVASPVQGVNRPGETGSDVLPRAEVWKFYVRDLETRRDGDLLYPNGRFIVRAGDTILEDTQNPYWDGLFPVDLWVWQMHHSHVWGDSLVASMRKPGEAWNRIADLMVKNMVTTGNVRIIGDLDALDAANWNKLDNLEALIIKKRWQRDLRYEGPPAYPPHYYQFLILIPQVMETLAGLIDIAPGGRKTPGASMGALEGYQQVAMSLLQQTARLLETTIERIGQKLISRIIQYYTSDRVFAVTGPQPEFTQYVYQRAKLLMNDLNEVVSVKNEHDGKTFLREFSYRVVPNSGLLMSRIQRILIAAQLQQIHVVDRRFVLDTLGPEIVPDPETVFQRATAEMQQLAQAGMQGRGQRMRSNRRGTALSPGTGA